MLTEFTDHFVPVEGVRLRYWHHGERGKALILLHGLLGSVENWRWNIAALGERWQVYALDAPGHGLSAIDPHVRELGFMRDILAGFIRSQALSSATVVAHSGGGIPALELALDLPHMIDRLVLLDSAGLGRDINSNLRFGSLLPVPPVIPPLTRSGVRYLMGRHVFADRRRVTDAMVDDVYQNLSRGRNVRNAMVMMRWGVDVWGQKFVFRDRLHELTMPTLVVWGEQDQQIPVAHAHSAAARIPDVRLEILRPCGHMPMLERPPDFNRVLMEFLIDNGG